jgi:hypothetical protein
MAEKPLYASGYRREQVELVQQTCLYVATKLGDLLDELVVVGGLVPSLLIPEDSLSEGVDPHIGTMDLDLGLALALLNGHRYEALTERLRKNGFQPDVNEEGKPTFQRWKIEPFSNVEATMAFGVRGENKDAYDLYYVIRNYGRGVEDVYKFLAPLLDNPETKRALEILQSDFSDPDKIGPRCVAEFLHRGPNEDLQADVVDFVRDLLSRCEIG